MQNQKPYHASIGKSVTFFMVGDAERLAVFLHCKMTRLARSVGSLPRGDTSGVGGEADMPRQPNRRD